MSASVQPGAEVTALASPLASTEDVRVHENHVGHQVAPDACTYWWFKAAWCIRAAPGVELKEGDFVQVRNARGIESRDRVGSKLASNHFGTLWSKANFDSVPRSEAVVQKLPYMAPGNISSMRIRRTGGRKGRMK